MKFLHMADLHLGKRLNDVSFLEDQKSLLQQAADIARTEQVEAVLIAGDVYQKASPQSEAMAVFDSFITQLRANGAKVFIISGNHDSAQRISYFSSLLKNAGVYVSEAFDGRLQQIRLCDEYGPLTVHLLPFVKPVQVRHFFPDQPIESYQEAVQAVLAHSSVNVVERNVLLCHQFIVGAERCDSEEQTIGGLDQIDGSIFHDFDYVALGHLHKPQCCMRDTMRYAGSLMKYSFSEVDQRKSITLVTMLEKGTVQWRTVPLNAPHDMRLVEGMLEDIIAMPYSEDYVWATIHDELPPPDARVSITTVFPNLMQFSVVNAKTKADGDVLARENLRSKSVSDLFTDFYRLQNNDERPTERHVQLLESILKELEDEQE